MCPGPQFGEIPRPVRWAIPGVILRQAILEPGGGSRDEPASVIFFVLSARDWLDRLFRCFAHGESLFNDFVLLQRNADSMCCAP